MPMLFPIRNKYPVSGLIDDFVILVFNFDLTIEDVSIMTFFTPMQRHFSRICNKAQLLVALPKNFAFNTFEGFFPV